MAPNDVQKLLDVWKIDEEVAFKYYEYTLEEEIITIKRTEERLFELVPEKSSINHAGPWYYGEMDKMLSRDGAKTLQVNVFGKYWDKSGGCECGAWKTRDPDCHADYCPKGRKFW